MTVLRCSAAIACALLLACGSDEPDGGGTNPRRRGRIPVPASQPPAAKPAAERPAAAPAFPAAPRADEPAAPAPTPAAAAPAAAKTEPERDLGAELRAAFGSPLACLQPRVGPDAPRQIQIELEAHLVATGLVTRGYARSSQLERSELACLERKLGALRLRAPIEGAPKAARTTIALELKPPEKSGR